MDGQRFDRLTRAFASGASRRSLLRGLLGIGGAAAVAAVVADDTDARRSSGSPPPNRITSTTTTTLPPCAGARCGYDCCETEAQCCDNECCPAGYDCLTFHFPEGPFVEEETCCPTERVCDTETIKCCPEGQKCCDGECIAANVCCTDADCGDPCLVCSDDGSCEAQVSLHGLLLRR